MASKSETVLETLVSVLAAGLPGKTVQRNAVETQEFPPTGLINIRDGELEEPEFWSTAWGHSRTVEISLAVQSKSERDSALDALILEVAGVIEADPSLGGVVESANVLTPQEVTDEPIDGDAGVKSAILPVVLEYTSLSRWG